MAEPQYHERATESREHLVLDAGLRERFTLPSGGGTVTVAIALEYVIAQACPEMSESDQEDLKQELVKAIWRGTVQSAARRFRDAGLT